LIEIEPEGGKIARAYAASPQIEAGNVYLPHLSALGKINPAMQCLK
jgi:phage terminase large subunit-like protein